VAWHLLRGGWYIWKAYNIQKRQAYKKELYVLGMQTNIGEGGGSGLLERLKGFGLGGRLGDYGKERFEEQRKRKSQYFFSIGEKASVVPKGERNFRKQVVCQGGIVSFYCLGIDWSLWGVSGIYSGGKGILPFLEFQGGFSAFWYRSAVVILASLY
jgi:hypothetical protein